MSQRSQQTRNRAFVVTGLGIALLVAVLLSPLASPDPDGLNRVAEDLGFAESEVEDAPARRLPFAQVFDGYALRGLPEGAGTAIAGLIGTLVTFGIAWGAGKLLVRCSGESDTRDF